MLSALNSLYKRWIKRINRYSDIALDIIYWFSLAILVLAIAYSLHNQSKRNTLIMMEDIKAMQTLFE